jgi:hypothetical protein
MLAQMLLVNLLKIQKFYLNNPPSLDHTFIPEPVGEYLINPS